MNRSNILVVDDNIINLELLESVLDEEGYDVRTAISGEMALKSIEAQKPDLILLDVMMPGINGYETCRLIKEDPVSSDIPVIFLSAKGEVVDKVDGFKAGAVDYLTKPFAVDEVLVRIKTHLSISFLQRKLEQKIDIIDKNVITSSTDLNGVITDASEAFCEISGYEKDELIGQRHNILCHEDMDDEIYADLWSTISSGEIWSGEVKNKKKDGNFYWVRSVISPNKDSNGEVIGYSSIRQDITDKKIIEEISITDQLTGLYNRRHFNDVFATEIKRSIRNSSILSFVMMDVDFFKQYNDTYGHQAGDNVLSTIGSTLKNYMQRSEDFAFRLGGEEFGVLYSVKASQNAEDIAEKIRKAVENLQIEHIESQVSDVVTISLGVVCVDFSKKSNSNQEIDNLYKIADDQLYIAKGSGRNRVSMRTL